MSHLATPVPNDRYEAMNSAVLVILLSIAATVVFGVLRTQRTRPW